MLLLLCCCCCCLVLAFGRAIAQPLPPVSSEAERRKRQKDLEARAKKKAQEEADASDDETDLEFIDLPMANVEVRLVGRGWVGGWVLQALREGVAALCAGRLCCAELVFTTDLALRTWHWA